jgi:DNA-binding MarR family transcriptional regulator
LLTDLARDPFQVHGCICQLLAFDMQWIVVMDTDLDRSAEVTELADQLMRFLLTAKRAMAKFGGPNKDGIEYPAYGLLARLVCDGPVRMTALAEAVHSDPSTVSRQTAALIRHGLVERRADPVDGRASLLAPTAAGERVFSDNRRRHNENMAKILSGWSSDEVRSLAVLLARLNTDLEAHERDRETIDGHPHHGLERRER